MEGILALLTDKHQTMVGAIFITGMPTHRASFARVIGVHLDGHAPSYESLRSNHALQLCKRPFGMDRIGFPLLAGRFFAFLAFGSISDISQILQPDQAVRMSGYNAFGDHVIGVGFQPSLSSAYPNQATGSGASAFPLQTLPQSRI